mmetsp:Transcript_8401/g.4537  ORF Transcript_8401/g.4537 Transcript_8401/m.4537 type:complete len:102 (+) Transcript_8401:233-538(+)
MYSGPIAAWAYKHVNPSLHNRVFVLGPSHHVYLPGAALPCSEIYDTPFGPIPIDHSIVEQLRQSNNKKQAFFESSPEIESAEHSLEMHFPFIRKVFKDKGI